MVSLDVEALVDRVRPRRSRACVSRARRWALLEEPRVLDRDAGLIRIRGELVHERLRCKDIQMGAQRA